MGRRALVAVGLFAMLLPFACSARPLGAVAPAGAPSPKAVATVPPPTQAPVPPPTQAPAPPPPTAAPAPAAPTTQTFALGGSGSVTVAMSGGSATITVNVSGLRAIAHAVHLHSGCDGSNNAHIAAIGTVGSAGVVSITVPGRLLGSTVIVYPDASATGRPILCGATA
jgi:hypothetical protein